MFSKQKHNILGKFICRSAKKNVNLRLLQSVKLSSNPHKRSYKNVQSILLWDNFQCITITYLFQ